MRCLIQATVLLLLFILCGFISCQTIEYSGDGEDVATTVVPVTGDEDLAFRSPFGGDVTDDEDLAFRSPFGGDVTDDEYLAFRSSDYQDLLMVLLNSRRSFFKEAIVNQTLSGVDCITKEKAIEIVFIIDGSFSLSTNPLVKNFVLESLRVFELDLDKTKVGILRMTGDSVETILSLQAGIHHSLVQFALNQYSNDGGLKQSFNHLKIPTVLSSNTDNQPHKVAIIIKSGGNGAFTLNKTELNNMGYKVVLVNIHTSVLMDMADKHINVMSPVGLPLASSDLDNYFKQTFLCDSCIPSPCHPSSNCISSKNSTAYTCICPPGFVGPPCVPADPCSAQPCPPPRICQTTGGNFSCVCPPNTIPPQCTAPCDAKPCKNGGTCVPSGNSFQCSCTEKFYGTLCEQNLCANIRCFYGQCVVRRGMAVCNCLPGYSGPECKDGGPCTKFSCLNGGKCVINNGSPNCDCPAPYFGSLCESNPCSNYDCQNEGTCYLYLGQPRCNCPSGYSGVKCENGPCLYYYKCQNGGTCEIRNGQPACKCQPNYYGADCLINLCAGITCLNGGKCKIDPQQSNFLTCICPTGFSGPTCADIVPLPCTNGYCLNGGTCLLQSNRAICTCPNGYFDPRCGTADPCNGYVCGNGGVCLVQTNLLPICQCQDGRTAAKCGDGERSNACNQNPCRNGCMCVESCKHEGGYYCRSTNGYLGKTCSIPPPSVLCEANQIRISINEALVQEVSVNLPTVYLYAAPNMNEINNPICKVFQSPYSFNLPFNQCGASNDVQPNGDLVVSNTIWLNRKNNGAFTMPVPVATFRCTYTKEFSIVTSIRPTMASIPPSITKTSGIEGTVELCKTASGCPNSCPSDKSMQTGAVYTVGEMMHMIIRTSSSVSTNVLSVDSLYLSCNPSPSNTISSKDFPLVSNGCPVATWYVDISHNAKQPNSLCASFRVPQLLACQSLVYIHAKLSTCPLSSTATCAAGSRACPTITRRKRSSSSNTSDEVVNVFGPIYILPGSKGRDNIDLFPEVTLEDDQRKHFEDSPSRFQKPLVISISTITLIFVVIIICSLFLYFRRSSKP